MRVLVAAFGHELGIEIGREETVLGIKEKMEVILGVPVSSQVLAVLGWELLDGLDMDDYPIVSEGTRIDLLVKSSDLLLPRRSRVGIIVKFSAQHIRIEIDGTETVLSLKEKIHLLEGTPEKRMSLFFSGKNWRMIPAS
ncbi:hypothetical protein MLD38_009128 [Melastoma candidum]|uniref:Uncharacterized protein n=1 Tax=Melastoma candidum TaxID=119954 RepID=A0ACB9S0V4_9MYRT|nr:hypothetical protein MLD38_009128 [Melastoma candidum]